MPLGLVRRYRVSIFWITLSFVYAVAIMPAGDAPNLGAGDKINHIAAFLVLTALGRFAYLERRRVPLFAGLCVFGALIEVTQTIPILERDGSLLDWIADCMAILVALATFLPFERRVRLFLG